MAINSAIDGGNHHVLMAALQNPSAALHNVNTGHIEWYMENCKNEKAAKAQVYCFLST